MGQTNPLLGVVLGCVVAVVLAVVLGVPILRLRGHYFGIATLGLALATEEIIANIDMLGGGSGITLKQDNDHYWIYYYAMWLVCAGSFAGHVADRAIEDRVRSGCDPRERGSRDRAGHERDAL